MPTDHFYPTLHAWMEASGISAEQLAIKCFEDPQEFQSMLEQKCLTEGIRKVLDCLMSEKITEPHEPVFSTVHVCAEKSEQLKELARFKNISKEELLSQFADRYFEM